MSSPCPIWITGAGTCTPLGSTVVEFSANILSGKSFIHRVEGFPVEEHPSQIAGQVLAVPCPEGEDPIAFAALPRLEQLTRWCCTTALRDAGLWSERASPRIGVALGIGAEWMLYWERDAQQHGLVNWAPPLIEGVLERTCTSLGMTGPAVAVSAACASGNVALAQGRAWVRAGLVDYCLAGACDMAVSPMSLAAFGNLRALSRRNASPQAASRPFDRGRDGFVMSEGGAVFVLESAERARARSAHAYAELAGYGASSDAHHMVIPSPDPGPATTAVRRALADARVSPTEIDHVNAHATSTPVGDAAEARILSAVFGDHVGHVPITSTKSATGHLLTAAAAVEALACIVSMREGAIPPTLNLDDLDPECAHLCHVRGSARDQRVRVAMSNSFGFGGSNTCLVLRAA